MITLARAASLVLAASVAVSLAGCKDDPPAPARVAPPPAVASAPAAAGKTRFKVQPDGLATFIIPAPLESAKGRFTKLRGSLDISPADLKATAGEIDLDLDDIKTETFESADNNVAQTGHAHNWMEIGKDVEAKRREENRWARFTIKAVESAAPATLAEAPEKDGARTVVIGATGDMWLHGVSSPKTVKLEVAFVGPAAAPTEVRIKTVSPVTVSLKEHDVKPRDVAGKFLSGALEKVGKKIDDGVQISLDVRAKPSS